MCGSFWKSTTRRAIRMGNSFWRNWALFWNAKEILKTINYECTQWILLIFTLFIMLWKGKATSVIAKQNYSVAWHNNVPRYQKCVFIIWLVFVANITHVLTVTGLHKPKSDVTNNLLPTNVRSFRWVMSKSDKPIVLHQFDIMSTIIPWIIWHDVQLLIFCIYNKFEIKKVIGKLFLSEKVSSVFNKF